MRLPSLLLAAALCAGIASAQTTRLVFKGSPSYPTIQSAIDASIPGDSVVVLPGTYNENIDFKGKDIHVRANSTTTFTGAKIQGTGIGSVVTIIGGETRKAILEGFEITGGLTSATTAYGAGVRIEFASPTIRRCHIHDNTAGGSGGGIGGYASSTSVKTEALIEDCLIERNKGLVSFGGGGGISFVSVQTNAIANTHEVRRCTIRDNEGTARGGGLYVAYGHGMVIDRCVFARNKLTTTGAGHYGGSAINFSLNCAATITNCLFVGNSGGVDGGGIKVFNTTNVRVVNSTFFGNSGGSLTAYNNTGVYNTPTGITAENCILWNNGTSELIVTSAATTSPTIAVANSDVSFTGWSTNITSSGTILNVDPQLVSPGGVDPHLLPTSPCIDKGNNTAAALPPTDIDGGSRTVGTAVDMGADEYLPTGCILYHDRGLVSVANPGTAKFTTDGGTGRAGLPYALVPGISGSKPGITFGPLHFPLNIDIASSLYIVTALDGTGRSTLSIPMTGLSASSIGVEVWFASAIFSSGGAFACFTNDVSLQVVQ